MTAPVLAHKKFYIIKPAEGRNQIKNPTFATPGGTTGWTAGGLGGGVTIEETGKEQRRGAYCMQVNPVAGVGSYVYHRVSVTDGLYYTFSCDLKGTSGVTISISIRDGSLVTKTAKNVTFTGYWQRAEVTWLANATATDYVVDILQPSTSSSNDPFYVDGVQFEQASAATTFIEGYLPGCRWEGLARNSASIRSAQYGLGGEIIDLEDYCHIVQVTGLGHGDWNQILTKMTSGGDMYQTHIRKSRQFSIIVDFTGNSLREIEANRKAVIDLIRPDLLTGQEMIVRYQGVDVNGDEATNPVDIVCVPLPATLVDTPDLPSYQRAVLNFTIPSGLLNGAYNEGAELDLYADFPAEHIVKRNPNGNWCKWNGSSYDNLMKGQGTVQGLNGSVYCMAEGPDGKIYVGGAFTDAGGTTERNVNTADYLARWNPVTEKWEKVVSGINAIVNSMAFDANGNLYIGGFFTNLGSTSGDYIAKITNLSGSPVVHALGTGLSSVCQSIAISPDGDVYAGGEFLSAGGVANTERIAKWDGASWSALSTGLNYYVFALAFAPNGDLYIGGSFTDVAYPYICKWNGSAFSAVGTAGDINSSVGTLSFGATGWLYVGGLFTNAGGITAADYLARWSGTTWHAIPGGSPNNYVSRLTVYNHKLYVGGLFTQTGDLTLTDRVAVYSNGVWQPLDIDLPGNALVYSVLPASDGSVYIGGNFKTSASGENAETGMVALNLNLTSASANTYPFMQVRGPGTLKSIVNYSTGKSIMFDGLTLNAGEWINLYFDPLNLIFKGGWSGRGNLMRYVVPGSDYGDFYLMPGENLISLFFPDSDPAEGSGAFISWTPLFWGLDGALL